jgi:hypothetical protein
MPQRLSPCIVWHAHCWKYCFEKFDILAMHWSYRWHSKISSKKSWIEVNIRDTTLSKNETKCNEF